MPSIRIGIAKNTIRCHNVLKNFLKQFDSGLIEAWRMIVKFQKIFIVDHYELMLQQLSEILTLSVAVPEYIE